MNYSIHTFELAKEIEFSEYQRIRDLFIYDAQVLRDKVIIEGPDFKSPKYRGIRIIGEYIGGKRMLKIIINMKNLLESDNQYKIFDAESDCVDEALKRANLHLSKIGYDIESLPLTRIDLCCDVDLKDDYSVQEIIKIAKKSIQSISFHNTYTATSRKEIKNFEEKNSFDVTNYKGENFVIYNKYRQLKNTKTPEEDAVQAIGIARVEYRLPVSNDSVNGVISNTETIKKYIENSKYLIREIIIKIFPSGVVTKMWIARNIVQSNIKRKKPRARVLKLIELTSSKKSLINGIGALLKEDALDFRSREKLKEDFQKLGLNPVTLGVRSTTIAWYSIAYIFGVCTPAEAACEDDTMKKISEAAERR